MSGPVMIGHLLLEKLARREQIRVPEADLIMQQQDQIAAFAASGRDPQILACVLLMVSGFTIVLLLEYLGRKHAS